MTTTSAETSLLTFRPHLEERIWGGRRLARYGRELPPEVPVGESWEISAIPGRSSEIARGPHAGEPFLDLLVAEREAIVGTRYRGDSAFPLLLKLLDSSTPLSIQLHPTDAEALRLEGPGEGKLGKTEAWLILDAEPGAEVVHGLAPGVDPRAFWARMEEIGADALPAEEERSWFRWVPVRAGDVVFVPAGTIHALGRGVVLAEVQQNSDITYRIYDWGRRDAAGRARELHVEKAKQISLPPLGPCPHANLGALTPSSARSTVLDCDRFRFDLVSLERGSTLTASTRDDAGSGFHLLFVWEGDLRYEAEGDTVALAPASFALVPACRGEYELGAPRGPVKALLVEAF